MGAACNKQFRTFAVATVNRNVSASRFEIQGEHLVFVNSKGDLAALFLMEIVASWNEIATTLVPDTPQTKRLALREKAAGVASPHPPTNEHCHHCEGDPVTDRPPR
jgi:hypothetical protein